MNNVTMHVSVKKADDQLHLTYQVRNGSGQRLYLYNVLPGEGTLAPDKNQVLVDIAADIVHIKKATPQPPKGKVIQMLPQRAYLTVIEAGAQFEETIELSLPLSPRSPYLFTEDLPKQKGLAKGIDFRVEYLPASPHYKVAEKVVDGETIKFLLDSGVPAPGEPPKKGYLTSPIIEMEIATEI